MLDINLLRRDLDGVIARLNSSSLISPARIDDAIFSSALITSSVSSGFTSAPAFL